jgi:LCP family protein required for cell wall assembly
MVRGRHFRGETDDDAGVRRESAPTVGRGRLRRSWRQRVLLGLGVLVVAGSALGAGAVFYVLRSYQGIERYEGLDVDRVAAGEPENYLVVGSDSRADAGAGERAEVGTAQRSDTIMVLRIDPRNESASALSFQRDLQVPIADTGETSKINSAYTRGRQVLIDTIKTNFGIEVHHYVEIDFAGFQNLIDQIGGVPLYFDRAVRDPEAGLRIFQRGCVNVDAEQALAFSRARRLEYRTDEASDGWEADGTSDHGRITRQQILMRAALDKALEHARSNPLQLKGMLDLASASVGLDEGLGIQDLLDLAERFKDFGGSGLHTYTLPITEVGEVGSADLHPDMAAAEPILNVFRGLPFDEVGPSLITVDVLNGGGEQDQGVNVAGALQSLGFEVNVPTDAPEPQALTTIYYSPGELAYGRRVARHLTGGAVLTEKAGLPKGAVQLVTGADFTTLHEQPIPVEQMPTPTLPTTTAPPAAGDAPATTATTAAPATTTTVAPTTSSTAPAPPPSTAPRLGYPAGETPPGVRCG